jgi:hypothetical protein
VANWQKLGGLARRLAVPESPGRGGPVKMLHEDYWLEGIDPEHRFGQFHEHFHAEWLKEVQTNRTKLSYWEWLEVHRNREAWQKLYEQNKSQLAGDRVEYLDETARADYRLQVRNGLLLDAGGRRFHTGNLKTGHSGSGWGIWVMDTAKQFYSHSHEIGKFHHSSFLAGTPVKSAGEWIIDRGKLVAITGKSGHYQPGEAQMLHTLFVLKLKGVPLTGVAVIFSFQSKVYYDALEVLSSGGKITQAMRPLKTPPVPGPWAPDEEEEGSDEEDLALAIQMVAKAPVYMQMQDKPVQYTNMPEKVQYAPMQDKVQYTTMPEKVQYTQM